jgi:hypothetical protein
MLSFPHAINPHPITPWLATIMDCSGNTLLIDTEEDTGKDLFIQVVKG